MTIESNIDEITKNIGSDITLIAVTKTRSLDEIKIAYNKGSRDFGENKVQEFLDKVDLIGEDVRWHIIGHLQRNKVKYIAGRVFMIHSLDSIQLLEEIEKQYSKINEEARVLIEINIGREPAKTGIFLEELDELFSAIEKCHFIKVKGLMAIIPIGDIESSRKYFKEIRIVWENVKQKKFSNISMDYLSMGMTNDYKIAIEEGSNMIRIGEGIFGKRKLNII